MIFMDRIEEIKKEVERRVANEKRFRHIMGVVDECEKLARLYSLSETDARRTVIAGLLHDITKTLPNEEHEMLMSDLGEKLDEETKKCPKTIVIASCYVHQGSVRHHQYKFHGNGRLNLLYMGFRNDGTVTDSQKLRII